MLFKDRSDAGRQLVPLLQSYKEQENTLVLGLARGGVVTAFEIAKALNLPLGIVVVRKVGAPGNEELALGAVTEKGEGIFNDHLITLLGVSKDYLKRQIEKEKQVAKMRLELYLGKRPLPSVKGKTVILVDDGIATG
ncbi:MAG TPA: phosphoribosyltransferase family protein, partial [Rhabdochlamydiaceae bacterium]|nr:phosphoribosyltransferase family protein [Rhabdochlamydiaceae bacterium]